MFFEKVKRSWVLNITFAIDRSDVVNWCWDRLYLPKKTTVILVISHALLTTWHLVVRSKSPSSWTVADIVSTCTNRVCWNQIILKSLWFPRLGHENAMHLHLVFFCLFVCVFCFVCFENVLSSNSVTTLWRNLI